MVGGGERATNAGWKDSSEKTKGKRINIWSCWWENLLRNFVWENRDSQTNSFQYLFVVRGKIQDKGECTSELIISCFLENVDVLQKVGPLSVARPKQKKKSVVLAYSSERRYWSWHSLQKLKSKRFGELQMVPRTANWMFVLCFQKKISEG